MKYVNNVELVLRAKTVACAINVLPQDRYLLLLDEAVQIGNIQQISRILDKGIGVDTLIVSVRNLRLCGSVGIAVMEYHSFH